MSDINDFCFVGFFRYGTTEAVTEQLGKMSDEIKDKMADGWQLYGNPVSISGDIPAVLQGMVRHIEPKLEQVSGEIVEGTIIESSSLTDITDNEKD